MKGVEELLLLVIEEKKIVHGEESVKLVTDYNKLTELYMIQGDYTVAEEYVHKAKSLMKKEGVTSNLLYAEVLLLEAELLYLVGDFEYSIEKYEAVRAFQLEKLHETHPKVAYTIQEEVMTKLALGLTEGVEDDLIQAVSIIRKSVGDDSRSYAESLKKLAIYYTHER